MKRILTGVKPTNNVHIGNYLGAIRPSIDLSQSDGVESFLFIADYHALTSVNEAKFLSEMTYDMAATWIACGLNPSKHHIYKQSEVPEIFELNWILSCLTPKGLMNRAHAYKAKVAANQEANKKDIDDGVNIGLYTYPVLMSSDILMFANKKIHVPVGEDQVQHIEIARDIASKFNNSFSEVFNLPEFVVQKQKLIPGLDGRKMSKSYNNGIPLFCDSKKLRKLIMKITTDSLAPEEPKETEGNTIFDLYKLFATDSQVADLAARYKEGIGWGHAKQALFEVMDESISPMRDEYTRLINDKAYLDKVLSEGAEKVRATATPFLKEIKVALGVS